MQVANRFLVVVIVAVIGCFHTPTGLLLGVCIISFYVLALAAPPADDDHRPPPNGGQSAPKDY